jgi:hypothetical protein
MREIKFKVWDIENKRWASDTLCFAVGEMSKRAEEKGYILCQFTGLYDKNGKEIYEGNIITYGINGSLKREIKWNEMGSRWNTTYKIAKKNIIIGDVYGREGYASKNYHKYHKK